MNNLKNKKVLFILAPNNFRDEEYHEPKKILEQAGAEVITCSKGVNEASGMLGGEAEINLKLADVQVKDYQGIVFVGGSGASVYFDNPRAHQLAKQANKQGKVLGAICIAPTILANAGLLVGRDATAFHTQESKLISKGANYTGAEVSRDGKIITAFGPGAAERFGEELVKAL